MRVWYRSIDQSNNFSGWRNLSSWTRVPVAVTFHRDRNELFVLLRGDDRRVYFEALDVNGEPLRRGPVTNVTSALAPGAAVMNGRIHVFTVDTNGNGFTTDFALAGDGAFIDQTTPRAIDGASLRSGISASFDDTAQRGILLAALGGDFRVRTFVAAAGERSFAWRRESANLAAGVSVTSNGLLFTKGLADGRVYWKPFGSGTYAPWPGM
jgi:hypothetical protein